VEISPEYILPPYGTKSITPSVGSGFKDGVLPLSFIYPDSGIIKIHLQDKEYSSRTATSGEILFIPAEFAVEIEEKKVAVGAPLNLSLRALNVQGDVTPNYSGTVVLSPQGVNPQDIEGGSITPYTVSSFEQGLKKVQLTYNRWGKIKIKAWDKDYPNQKGESSIVEFIPYTLTVKVEIPPQRNFLYVGEDCGVVFSILDVEGNPISNYEGKIKIHSPYNLELLEEYQFVKQDRGSKKLISPLSTPGVYKIWVEEEQNSLVSEAWEFEVKSATLIVSVAEEMPLGVGEADVLLVDEKGKVIPDSNIPVKVSLQEEQPDNSAYSPATATAITLNEGRGKIVVGDSKAELVTITPYSPDLKFKVKKAVVRFGRLAKTGVGIFMWQEKKEEE
jgi:hypothetical protein